MAFRVQHSSERRPWNLRDAQFKADYCEVWKRVYRGEVDTPKTDHSVRNVAFAPSIQIDFDEWRTVSPWTEQDDWVFPSEKRTTSVWRDTLWRRHVAPKLKAIGLGWVNFQVLRRTHSSLMHDLEIDPKLVADQLGHTLDVNQNVYTKAALRRRQEAVRKLDEAVSKSLVEPNGARGSEGES